MPVLDCVPAEVLLEFTQPDPPKAEPIETAFQIIERGFHEHLEAFQCLQDGVNALPESTPHGVTARRNSAGSPTNLRTQLNFIEGAGITLLVADDPVDGEYDITIEVGEVSAIVHGLLGGLTADDHLQYIHTTPTTSVRNTIKPTVVGGDVVNLVLDKPGAPVVPSEDYLRFIVDSGTILTRVDVDGHIGFGVDPQTFVHVRDGPSGAAMPSHTNLWMESSAVSYVSITGGIGSDAGIVMGDSNDPDAVKVYSNFNLYNMFSNGALAHKVVATGTHTIFGDIIFGTDGGGNRQMIFFGSAVGVFSTWTQSATACTVNAIGNQDMRFNASGTGDIIFLPGGVQRFRMFDAAAGGMLRCFGNDILDVGGMTINRSDIPRAFLHIEDGAVAGLPPTDTNVWLAGTGVYYLCFTAGATSLCGVLMGDVGDLDAGRVLYSNNDNEIQLWALGAIQVAIADTFVDFKANEIRDAVWPNVEVSGATTLDNTHRTVYCDASGGAFTITLPALPANDGRRYTIKKIDSSSNAVTVDGDGSNIDGDPTRPLTSQHDSLRIEGAPTEWRIH